MPTYSKVCPKCGETITANTQEGLDIEFGIHWTINHPG